MSDIDTSREAMERLLAEHDADRLSHTADRPWLMPYAEGIVRALLDERDALVEDAQGQDDRIVQLIERAEAAAKLLAETMQVLRALIAPSRTPGSDWGALKKQAGHLLTRYAERATSSSREERPAAYPVRGNGPIEEGAYLLVWSSGTRALAADRASALKVGAIMHDDELVTWGAPVGTEKKGFPLAEWQSIEQAISWAAIHDRPRDPVGTEKEEER